MMFSKVAVDDVVKFDIDDLIDCRVGVITENEDDIEKAIIVDGSDYSFSCFCVIAPTSIELDVYATHLSYITNCGDIIEIRTLNNDELKQVEDCIKNSSWVSDEMEVLKRNEK